MKLFLVYLGGRIQGGHIEMHDVRFVVGESIEQCYSKLKKQWIGDKNSVHMDSYMVVENIDGYQVELVNESVEQAEKLYFVNLGAYHPTRIAEQHDFALFVAKNAEEAKNKAKSALLAGLSHLHKDDLYDVDECFTIDLADLDVSIKLTYNGLAQPMIPNWYGYHVLK